MTPLPIQTASVEFAPSPGLSPLEQKALAYVHDGFRIIAINDRLCQLVKPKTFPGITVVSLLMLGLLASVFFGFLNLAWGLLVAAVTQLLVAVQIFLYLGWREQTVLLFIGADAQTYKIAR